MSNDLRSVGVLLPSYNHAKYIEARVNSILNQNFKNISLYIFDDCSTDDSWEILIRYQSDPRVNLYRSPSPSGSPFSYYLNVFKKYNHDYWWIAESDDVADQNLISTLHNFLENDQSLSFAYSGSTFIDHQGAKVGTARSHLTEFFPEINWHENHKLSRDMGLEMLVRGQIVPNMSSLLFRTSSLNLKKLEVINKFKLAGDWYFVVMLQSVGNGFYFHGELNQFRHHEATARVRTDSEKRSAEYLFCNYEAWKNLRPRGSIFNAIQDTLAMARNDEVSLFKLYVTLSKISKSAVFNLTKELLLESVTHPNRSFRKIIRYSGLVQRFTHMRNKLWYFLIGRIRHGLFLFGVIKRRFLHYYFLLGVVKQKFINICKYILHIQKMLIFRPRHAVIRIKEKITRK